VWYVPLLIACADVRCDCIGVVTGSTPAASVAPVVTVGLGLRVVLADELDAELLPAVSVSHYKAR
jgi:hypothetical protein